MAKRNHRPHNYHDIKHSPDGLMASGLACLSAGCIIAELILTIRARGQAGGMAGFVGVAAFLLSIVGLVFAIVSWKDEETLDFFKRFGTLFNTGLLLINLLIVLLGFIF